MEAALVDNDDLGAAFDGNGFFVSQVEEAFFVSGFLSLGFEAVVIDFLADSVVGLASPSFFVCFDTATLPLATSFLTEVLLAAGSACTFLVDVSAPFTGAVFFFPEPSLEGMDEADTALVFVIVVCFSVILVSEVTFA